MAFPRGPDFNQELFSQTLQEKGARVNWYKAVICSCLSPRTQQPEPTCPYCHGTGFVYSEPIETKVIVTSITAIPEYMLSGLAQFGELLITPDFDFDFSVFDRIVFLDYLTEYIHGMQRSQIGDTDTARYEILEPEQVFYEGTYYELGSDFEIDSTDKTKLTWLTDNRPPAGARYGIRYKSHPVYLISRVLNETRATWVRINGQEVYKELPQRYLAKKEFSFTMS